MVILVAHNSDPEPVGKDEYKKALKVLMEKDVGKFTSFIKSNEWTFVPDQWQVQKWDQFFKKVGDFNGLIYCTTGIRHEVLRALPGRSGYDFLKGAPNDISEIVQASVDYCVRKAIQTVNKPTISFIKEGPYSIPKQL